MKKLLLVLSFCAALWAAPASATCSAVFKPGSVCGNAGASNAFPGEIPNSSIVGTIPLPSADILVGNASNKAAAVAPSGAGDCTFTISNAGVFTYTCLKTNGVSFGPFATGTNAANLTGTVPSSTLPSPFTSGTATGNTSKFATSTGTLTTNDCVKIDASGNYIDAGVACGGTNITVGTTGITSGVGNGPLTNNSNVLGNVVWGQLPGIASNTAASAGNVGEILSCSLASGSAVTMTSTSSVDICSKALTVGDWDCSAVLSMATFIHNSTDMRFWINTTSATDPGAPNSGAYFEQGPLSGSIAYGGPYSLHVGPIQILSNGSTTAFLTGNMTSSGGNNTAFGFMRCRRMR